MAPHVVAAYLGGGVALLWFGAEFLVRGASRLAMALGMSAMAVGLTVVAFATSSPELVVSIWSSAKGESDIAIGNVVGSNIFNIVAILGLTALVCPIRASAAFIFRETPIMVLVALALPVLAWDGAIQRPEAVGLLGALAAYVLFAYWMARRGGATATADFEAQAAERGRTKTSVNILLITVGIAMLIGGSHLLVGGAKEIAHWVGLRDAVIGLTIVAAGTSLPELATSVVAARRKQPDIALGNIIGSNIFNILGILGAAGLVHRELPVSPALMRFDIPVMIGVSVLLVPLLLTGRRIARAEGALLLAIYVGYTGYVVLKELAMI